MLNLKSPKKIAIFISLIFILGCKVALAAPSADLWDHWVAYGAETGIDHKNWQKFLDKYLVEVKKQTKADKFSINALKYSEVTKEDLGRLDSYVKSLEAVDILKYTRDEQFAYWVNLYNSVTVRLILERYPVKSITKIKSSFLAFGPWDKKILKIYDKEVSLNDIEHRILRPIWKDKRIHYIVNCASFSCPNLGFKALTADNYESLLEVAASNYLNDSRGLKLVDGRLVLSSIMDWYRDDFGSHEDLAQHIYKYNKQNEMSKLLVLLKDAVYDYDWSLNGYKEINNYFGELGG